jgi:hypothetical protein
MSQTLMSWNGLVLACTLRWVLHQAGLLSLGHKLVIGHPPKSPLNMKNVESTTQDVNVMEWSHPSPLRCVHHQA